MTGEGQGSQLSRRSSYELSLLREERLRSEYRQHGALIFAFGICATFGALAKVASRVGSDGTTANEGIPLASLIAHVAQAFFGTVAMATGYVTVVMDSPSLRLTGVLIILIQLAWFPYIINMEEVGQSSRDEGIAFIPKEYNPERQDERWLAAMGVMAIMAYGIGYIGSLAFVTFSLSSYQTGMVNERSSGYYKGRLMFYSIVLSLAGFTQLTVGSYVLGAVGRGPLEKGPVEVAMYTVFFPEITYFVGLLQLWVGMYGFLRSQDMATDGKDDNTLEVLCGLTYLCMLILQNMVQVSYAPGNQMADKAPTDAFMMLGLIFMPAFLDYKMRHTPEFLDPLDFGFEDEAIETLSQQEDLGKNEQEYRYRDEEHIRYGVSELGQSQDNHMDDAQAADESGFGDESSAEQRISRQGR